METLVLNGKQYVKASKAARDLGYTSDYVGQLCRGGHVDAHLVGRTWYVNADTLTNHQVEKKRNSRVKAREYAKKAIEESKTLKVHEAKKGYKDVAIRYAGDKHTLIPEVRKVAVESAPVVKPSVLKEDDSPAYAIENENKKIVMSGTLKIQDAENAPVETDTVVLRPSFRKSTHAHTKPRAGILDTLVAVEDDEVDILPATPKTFAERIQEYQDADESVTAAVDSPTEAEPKVYGEQVAPSSDSLYYAFLVLLAIVAGLSIFFEQKVLATSQFATTTFEINFSLDTSNGL